MHRIAALDIGTNTILMVIAKVHDSCKFSVISDSHSLARLGESVSSTRLIQPQAVERAKNILIEYKKLILQNDVDRIYAVGTAVFRDAANGEAVRKELTDTLGTEIKIIEGVEEARLSFLGAIENPTRSIMIDIGGGSTEIAIGKDFKVEISQSLKMGAVKLFENIIQTNPAKKDKIEKARQFIRSLLKTVPSNHENTILYAVAGTPTTLAQIALDLKEFDSALIQGYIFNRNRLNEIINTLSNMTSTEIVEQFNIPLMRADVITTGAIILDEILNHFSLYDFIVSGYGLRYGVLKNGICSNTL